MREEQKMPSSKEKLELLAEQLMGSMQRTGELEMVVYNISRENEILRNAIQLIHEKLNAVINLQNSNQSLSDENINNEIVKMKENSLKQKVDEMLEKGNIELAETVGEDSFIVSRELDKNGKVENPRLQFLVAALNEDLKAKFLGKKAGDLVVASEDKLDIEIMEIYNLAAKKLDSSNDLPMEEAKEETTQG